MSGEQVRADDRAHVFQHPRLVAAIREQAARLCTIQPAFANDRRGEAARLIAELAPGPLTKVFFTNGGAEANENAIRLARGHTGRHRVLATYRSYHGATGTAITATGDPRRLAARDPSVARCAVTADEVRTGLAILDEALAVADRYYAGQPGIA